MNRTNRRRNRLAPVVHAARVGLVVALLLAIPSPVPNQVVDAGSAPQADLLTQWMGAPVSLDPEADGAGLWTVKDLQGNKLAKIARTLPLAEDVVGYRGPTESLIVFDDALQIADVWLMSSADTLEHVDAVKADEAFFEQFRSWSWGGPQGDVQVDAVSGATLTSLAMAEGILKRIGGDRPSLVFPGEITDAERAKWIADPSSDQRLIRTGPLTDDIVGYQGPSELLIRVEADQTVDRIRLRESFDNEPYVGYVRTEAGFWALFQGKKIEELAEFDPVAEQVEGVSGATMTSLAVADTIVATAQALQKQKTKPAETPTSIWSAKNWSLDLRWTMADVATIVVLLALAVFSSMRWFRIQWLRRLWLLGVVVVVGLWAGNLVSMALIAGWGAEGIAWRLAPGLSAIAVVAMVSPSLAKGNPYCNHLCPHGALQQLIRPTAKSRRRLRLPPKLQLAMRWVPGVTLVIAYLMLVLKPTLDLSSWEPFHAYLFRIASWSAIGFAVGSLAIAAVIPMGYCRLGCPTGQLLDYLRRTSQSHRILAADFVALGLLLTAWWAKTF